MEKHGKTSSIWSPVLSVLHPQADYVVRLAKLLQQHTTCSSYCSGGGRSVQAALSSCACSLLAPGPEAEAHHQPGLGLVQVRTELLLCLQDSRRSCSETSSARRCHIVIKFQWRFSCPRSSRQHPIEGGGFCFGGVLIIPNSATPPASLQQLLFWSLQVSDLHSVSHCGKQMTTQYLRNQCTMR